MNAFMKSIDTMVLGRKTYEVSLRLGAKLMGGGEIIASFLDQDAIDEFVISVVPVFIGEGIPLIARRHRHVPLELLATTRFDDGLVQLHYRVKDARA